MNVTRLSPTTFAVEAASLSCNRPGCKFVTRRPGAKIGDSCPRCERNQVNVAGVLERTTYHCDIEALDQNGCCACWHFQYRLAPALAAMSPANRMLFRKRCKHLKLAREFAKRDENFDVILATLPNQEEQC